VFRINPLGALVLLAFTVVAVPSAAQAKGGDLSVRSVWSDNGELTWNCLPQTFLRTMCGQYQNERARCRRMTSCRPASRATSSQAALAT
jgi:hypothetical protein